MAAYELRVHSLTSTSGEPRTTVACTATSLGKALDEMNRYARRLDREEGAWLYDADKPDDLPRAWARGKRRTALRRCGLALGSRPHFRSTPLTSRKTDLKENPMFARIVGATLGLFLALGATVVVNPDGRVADAVQSVATDAEK